MQERIVYIRRVEGNDKTRLPKDLQMDAKRDIGPSFDKFGQVLKGVQGEEERKLMPQIIGIDTNDNTFQKRVQAFWNNISIKVKSGPGVKLNITIGEDGMPIVPIDYIKWKYALKYGHCVEDEAGLEANPYALFYIHDPVTATTKKANELSVRNEAKLKYLELIQDENKMDAVLTVMTTYKNPAILSPSDKQLILEEQSNKNPKLFTTTVKDEKLMFKSFVHRCINAGVFNQSGSRVIYDGSILGEDVDSTVAYLKSKEGSKIYVIAEGKLNEWTLNK